MTWNYRVVEHPHPAGSWFGLHEVYYNAAGVIEGYTDEQAVGNDLADLQSTLRIMLSDAESRPVLTEEELNRKESN